jgi:hypothetical protein
MVTPWLYPTSPPTWSRPRDCRPWRRSGLRRSTRRLRRRHRSGRLQFRSSSSRALRRCSHLPQCGPSALVKREWDHSGAAKSGLQAPRGEGRCGTGLSVLAQLAGGRGDLQTRAVEYWSILLGIQSTIYNGSPRLAGPVVEGRSCNDDGNKTYGDSEVDVGRLAGSSAESGLAGC